MPSRDHSPMGSPCWADLWTSDVEASRTFYAELFGWEAQEPSPEFGGYFMFTRGGVPIAGGMGDMGDLRADDSWKIYLTSNDIATTIEVAQAEGAEIVFPPMAVSDLGIQSVLVDPTGATLGIWQRGTFPGFTVLGEHGAPSWFELQTRDYATAVAFYRSVFHVSTSELSDPEAPRYTTLRDRVDGQDLAGIVDAARVLPAGAPSTWTIYWQIDDIDASFATAKALGGRVVADAEDTPYGRVATVTDPAGAQFKLHTPKR